MSVLKSELKQMITHEIGVRVEDAMDAAKTELAVLEGRQAAFLDGSKAVEALMGAVDKDVETEKYGLEVAEVAKRYLSRAVNALQNLSVQASQFRIAQTGKVQGFDHTVKLLANIVASEKAKIAELQAQGAAAEGSTESAPENLRDRPVGLRSVSIKAQRQAEAAAEAAAAEAVSAVVEVKQDLGDKGTELQSEPPLEKEAVATIETSPKKRGGKRANNA